MFSGVVADKRSESAGQSQNIGKTMKPILAFCADLQARESAYKSTKDLKGDDLYALRQVVDKCLELDIPLILGGDQVDSPTISDEHTVALRRELARMKQPVWYIDGNHERGYKCLSLEGGNAAVAVNLEESPVEVSGVKIRGFNWRSRRMWEDYLQNNEIPSADIMVLHGFADQVVSSLGLPKDEKPICDMDLEWFDGRCKLALMGDIHMEWDYTGSQKTHFLYSGSMWMHRVGEPELKSFVLVFEDLSVQRVSLNCRPFLKASVKSEADAEKIVKWLDLASSRKDTQAMEAYMGSRLPRVHVTVASNIDSATEKILKQVESKAFVFRKVDHSHDPDLTEIKGSLEEKVDIDTALAKLLDSKVESDSDATAFIKHAMQSGFEEAVAALKNKVGLQ
jgi:DNA repair exonuclease SbcCD nuclease subunit